MMRLTVTILDKRIIVYPIVSENSEKSIWVYLFCKENCEITLILHPFRTKGQINSLLQVYGKKNSTYQSTDWIFTELYPHLLVFGRWSLLSCIGDGAHKKNLDQMHDVLWKMASSNTYRI